MKMAKPSGHDLDAAHQIAAALEAVSNRWSPIMPAAIAIAEGDDCDEAFSPDNAEQCERVFTYLRQLDSHGSLFRVVMGMCVLCDPKNKLIDPNDDCLAYHPDIVKSLSAKEPARGN